MSEAKHTPGPWSVYNFGMWVDAKRGMMRICDIRGWGHLTGIGAMHLPEAEAIAIQTANARLIAAAPELLAKLIEADRLIIQLATVILNEKIADHIPYGLDERAKDWLRDGATSVLAKAEGR